MTTYPPALPSRQKRPVERYRNVSAQRYQPVGECWADEALCAYCGRSYVPTRKNQKYHDARERKWNCERKAALKALVEYLLLARGCKAFDMAAVARQCVEVAYDALRAAVAALGFKYDQKRKVWRTKTFAARQHRSAG